MFKDLMDRVSRSRLEDPERFTRNVSKLVVGVFITAFIMVAAVNVASVITVFPV